MQNVELTYFQARSIACVCLMKFAYGSRSKLSTTCQTFLHRMENLKTRRCKRKRNNSYQMLRAEAGGGNKQQEQPFRRNMFRSLHADQKIVSQVRYFCILHCLYFVYVQIHILSCCTFPGHSQRLILNGPCDGSYDSRHQRGARRASSDHRTIFIVAKDKSSAAQDEPGGALWQKTGGARKRQEDLGTQPKEFPL